MPGVDTPSAYRILNIDTVPGFIGSLPDAPPAADKRGAIIEEGTVHPRRGAFALADVAVPPLDEPSTLS